MKSAKEQDRDAQFVCDSGDAKCGNGPPDKSSLRSLDDQLSGHRRMHQAGVGKGAALGRADLYRQ